MLGLGDVSAALEHDVLEEVREPGLARLLVLGADVVPDVDGDDRREVVLRDDEAQAVGEALVGERHGRDRGGRHEVGSRVRTGGRGVRPIVPRRLGTGSRARSTAAS